MTLDGVRQDHPAEYVGNSTVRLRALNAIADIKDLMVEVAEPAAAPTAAQPYRPEDRIVAILFADTKGYSTLNSHQLLRLNEFFEPSLATNLKSYEPFFTNTWGDGIVAAFNDPLAAANCALALRDHYRNWDWEAHEIPSLKARIALHCGFVRLAVDPITMRGNMVGQQVIEAARIEPITDPGDVWATDSFVAQVAQRSTSRFTCEDIGERELAKAWGTRHLFRLARSQEAVS